MALVALKFTHSYVSDNNWIKYCTQLITQTTN